MALSGRKSLDLPPVGSFRILASVLKAITRGKINRKMNRFLKTLLLWLLLAALPLQGMAAALQTACGPTERNGSSGTAASMPSHHHHDGDTGHAHVADGDTASESPTSSDKSSDAGHTHSGCSACASCCVGAAAPPSTLDLPAVHGDSLPVVISPIPLVAGVVPGGLERPPRRVTA